MSINPIDEEELRVQGQKMVDQQTGFTKQYVLDSLARAKAAEAEEQRVYFHHDIMARVAAELAAGALARGMSLALSVSTHVEVARAYADAFYPPPKDPDAAP